MSQATLLSTLEAKSKIISHARLLEMLSANDIETRSVKCEANDSLMRITVVSNQDMPLHSHFQNTGMQFLGLGFLPGDEKKMWLWLHQWLMLSMTKEDVDELHGTKIMNFEEVQKQIKKHQESLCAWFETSRGW